MQAYTSHIATTGDQELEALSDLTPNLLVWRRGPVGWIIFNRPEKLNALTNAMYGALEPAWRTLEAHPLVRAIVTTGEGRAFSVGVDLAELATHPEGHAELTRQAQENRRRLTAQDLGISKPVVCAVNGLCAGGGLHFVVDADIIIATRSATFMDPHVSVGQVATSESIAMARRLPFGEALRLALCGSSWRLSATRAHQIGLVSEVVDSAEALAGRAEAIALGLAAGGSAEAALVKRQVWAAIGQRSHAGSA